MFDGIMDLPNTQKALDAALSKLIPFASLMIYANFIIYALVFGIVVYNTRSLLPRSLEWLGFHLDSSNSLSSTSSPLRQEHAPPLKAADHINDGKKHLLLAATGSVATIKIPNIVEALSKHDDLSIRILLSTPASNFLQDQSHEQPSLAQIARNKNVDGVYHDVDEWRKPWVRGDNILHIELRRWADLMVIAPLSANSLAKLALGLSDSLISSVVRAWDVSGLIDQARPGVPLPYNGKKGIIVAPAMNTAMWHHPVTAEHIRRLEQDWNVKQGGWFEVLRPIEKELACGDIGSGAMHDWKLVVAVIESRLGLGQSQGDAETDRKERLK